MQFERGYSTYIHAGYLVSYFRLLSQWQGIYWVTHGTCHPLFSRLHPGSPLSMPRQVFAVDATNTKVYSWNLGEGVYLEANTYTVAPCGVGDNTGLVAHPTYSYIYVRRWLGWSTQANTLCTEWPATGTHIYIYYIRVPCGSLLLSAGNFIPEDCTVLYYTLYWAAYSSER